MSKVFISDLHIKSEDDIAHDLYQKFIEHPITQNADEVYLLGDIFDLFIGNHKAYIKRYPYFFNSIKNLLNQNKKVYFFEGNHDFHIRGVFKRFLKNVENKENFFYMKSGIDKMLLGKKSFICHGYEVDFHNKYFKRWYRIYNSYPFYILVTFLLPYALIQYLGDKASKDSKKRGKKTFNYEAMENKYIQGARDLLAEKKIDIVVSGHTHIPADKYYEGEKRYLNVGFPVRDRQFLEITNKEYKFIKL